MTIEQLKKQDKNYAIAIANYLIKRIETDQCLKEKIESTNKTLKGCIGYCKSEARKQAEDNCAIIPDDEVYEWVVHYFLEDSLNEENYKSASSTPTTTKDNLGAIEEYNKRNSTAEKKNIKKKDAKKVLVEQLSLFDME